MAEALVIDANVVAKWFLKDEEHTDLADVLLAALLAGRVLLHAPDLLLHEVCATITKACRPSRDRLRLDKALDYIRDLFALPLSVASIDASRSLAASQMAVANSKTYNDMIYVRLAEELECRFCTADERLTSKSGPWDPTSRVLSLTDVPSLFD